jgi:hypothetical protein
VLSASAGVLGLALGMVLGTAGCGCGVGGTDAGGAGADGAAATDGGGAGTDAGGANPVDAGASVDYGATVLIGALDRIVLTKSDVTRDLCFQVRLVRPAGGGSFAITAPAGFAVEFATVAMGASPCDTTPPAAGELATGGSGTIVETAPPGAVYPCELGLDFTIDFDPGAPTWVPATEPFLRDLLPVSGC